MHPRARRGTIAICFLTAGFTGSVMSTSPAAAHAPARIAVHGKFHATLTPGGDFACATGRVPITVRAVGVLSRLGAATSVEQHCLDPVSGQDDALITLTFADGDMLRQHDTAQVQPGSTSAATRIRGTWQVEGGTGRFANATGAGRIRGLVDEVSGVGLVRVHGHLSGVTA